MYTTKVKMRSGNSDKISLKWELLRGTTRTVPTVNGEVTI